MVQCPRCGKPVQELISGTCSQCFIDTKEILRVPKIQLTICPDCLRYKDASIWRKGEDDLASTVAKALLERLPRKLRLTLGPHQSLPGTEPRLVGLESGSPRITKDRATVDVVARVGGIGPGNETAEIRIRPTIALNKGLCRVCRLRRSGFHGCILQIRAEARYLEEEEVEDITALVHGMVEKADPNTMDFISKVVDRREGRDFYLGSAALGRTVAREVVSSRGGTISESRKLVGVEKGTNRKLYRFTTLLRLPELRVGDITELNGVLYAVLHHSGRRTTLLNLQGETLSHEGGKARLEVMSRREDIGEALVTEVRPDGIQILDPRTNQTLDIQMDPKGILAGSTINVIWRDDIPQIVPTLKKEVDR